MIFFFQHMKQIPEINGFSKKVTTLEGRYLHIENAYLSWENPTEKHPKDNFQQNKLVALNT